MDTALPMTDDDDDVDDGVCDATRTTDKASEAPKIIDVTCTPNASEESILCVRRKNTKQYRM